MAEDTCEKADCTLVTTGKCLLSQPYPRDCPHFRSSDSIAEDVTPEDTQQLKVEKQSSRRFHSGTEIGTVDAIEIMRAQYSHLIGVLGSTDAGKTCFLSSLYLMASNGSLPESYRFAGSLTLQAFEDRARGLREWNNGILPNQLTDHTVLTDHRQPSLLHLAIRESDGDRRKFNLLLTDLPGEWTDNLVLNAAYAETFRFLHRADGIILVVDGNLLLSNNDRHIEMQRMRYFSERLANDVGISQETPFVILISKSDEIEMQMPPAAIDLQEYVSGLGFPVTTILAAAFSRKPAEFKNGTGVFTAITTILSHPATSNCGHSIERLGPHMRTFLNFRG